MKLVKRLAVLVGILSFSSIVVASAHAASYTLTPWIYDPDNTGSVVSQLTANGVHLEKNAPTATNAAAGAAIGGVNGLSTTGMTLAFDVSGYCGAGAPRFNVYLSNGSTVFLGCVYGNDGTGHVTFTAGQTYGGVLFPEGQTVTGIDIVQDEEGQTTLSNIMVNGTTVMPSVSALRDRCKNYGWRDFTPPFRNQGQCVSSFSRHMP